MAKKCGCASQACTCQFVDSDSMRVDGVGSVGDPFVVDRILPLIADDTTSINLELTETDDGYTLSAAPLGSQSSVQVFTSNGTWTKPSGVQMVRLMIIGGGGGGAGGAALGGISGSNPNIGAPGGAGGSVTIATLVGADIPSSAAVVVGLGGAGGAAGTDVNGSAGTAGGNSSFNGNLIAGGGNAGNYNNTLAATPSPIGNVPGDYGGSLDPALGQVYGAMRQNMVLSPGGGGIGAYANGSSALFGSPGSYSLPAQGRRDLSTIQSGENDFVDRTGVGGAGGDYSRPGDTSGPPINDGKPGGLYGAGGGGGASSGGTATGAGGAGARGVVVVMAW